MKIDAKYQKKLKKFGLKVRQVRLEKGWTLEETEEHGWPNWRHLQKIEAGKNVTLATVLRLCDVFEISPSKLIEVLN